MNLWQVMEKYNRIIGTMINSTIGKNELPGKILSFNADKLFSKQNSNRRVICFVVLCLFHYLIFWTSLSEILKFQGVTEAHRGLVKTQTSEFLIQQAGWNLRIAFVKFPNDTDAAGPGPN